MVAAVGWWPIGFAIAHGFDLGSGRPLPFVAMIASGDRHDTAGPGVEGK